MQDECQEPPYILFKQHKEKAFKAIFATPKSIRDCIYYYGAGVLISAWQTGLYMYTRDIDNSTYLHSVIDITLLISDSRAQQRLGGKS